jgi:hypothetical protein
VKQFTMGGGVVTLTPPPHGERRSDEKGPVVHLLTAETGRILPEQEASEF